MELGAHISKHKINLGVNVKSDNYKRRNVGQRKCGVANALYRL